MARYTKKTITIPSGSINGFATAGLIQIGAWATIAPMSHIGTGPNQVGTLRTMLKLPEDFDSLIELKGTYIIYGAPDVFQFSLYVNGVVDTILNAVNLLASLTDSVIGTITHTPAATLAAGDYISFAWDSQVDNTEENSVLYVEIIYKSKDIV